MLNRQTRRQLLKGSVLGSAAALAIEVGAQPTNGPDEAPRQYLSRLIDGFTFSQMIHVAAKLRIADQLAAGPLTVAQLAAATKTHADYLYRVLRTLAGMGIFAEEEDFQFRLTPAAELLRSGVPGSMRTHAEVVGEERMWRPWGALFHSVTTGETAFDHLYGKNTFDWFREHPAAARLADSSYTENTAPTSEAIAAAYDFSSARTVVDVGGGEGSLLASILRRNRSAHGVLFDLDHVVASARTKLDRDIAVRCEFVGGDFFKAVPAGGDLYVMKHILHDWNDGRANKILNNCRRAMAGRGKLLVVDYMICRRNQPCFAKQGDINMMVRTGGRNRTEKEYRDLFAKSGFDTARAIRSVGELSLIEALP